MSGAMRKIVILIGSLSLLALPLVASADEGDENPTPPDDSQLVYHYDNNVLLFGFFPDGTNADVCTPAESAVDGAADGGGGTTDDGGTTADDGETATELSECTDSLTIEGSVGKANHGSFLSLFTKAFKAAFEGDTPFGHYVRQFAKSDLGKTDKADKSDKAEKADKGSDDGDGSETDGDDGGSGKPDKTPKGNHGNGHGKGKKGD